MKRLILSSFCMAAFTLCLLGLAGCAGGRLVAGGAAVQTGIASWYGPDFHGKATSSCEVYDMYDLTAAHKSLPFGTKVMVTNLDNNRSVCVRINDRGPFIEGRIIDLSYAAARMVDLVGTGTAPVRIELLKNQPPDLKPVRYAVQAGAFSLKDNALTLEGELGRTYKNVYISTVQTASRTYYRVRIKAKDLDSSEKIAKRLCGDGYDALICEFD